VRAAAAWGLLAAVTLAAAAAQAHDSEEPHSHGEAGPGLAWRAMLVPPAGRAAVMSTGHRVVAGCSSRGGSLELKSR